MTTGDNQLGGWTEKKLQSTSHSQTCTKKRYWSLFGGLLSVGCTTAFWIPAKPLQLRHLLNKSMRYTENCNACSQHWSTERGPILLHDSVWWYLTARCTTNASKVEWIGPRVLPHPPYSPDLSPTDHHFFKHLDSFLQGEQFHNQQEAEDAFQEFVEFRSTDVYATGMSKLISHWQKCTDCNGFYSD